MPAGTSGCSATGSTTQPSDLGTSICPATPYPSARTMSHWYSCFEVTGGSVAQPLGVGHVAGLAPGDAEHGDPRSHGRPAPPRPATGSPVVASTTWTLPAASWWAAAGVRRARARGRRSIIGVANRGSEGDAKPSAAARRGYRPVPGPRPAPHLGTLRSGFLRFAGGAAPRPNPRLRPHHRAWPASEEGVLISSISHLVSPSTECGSDSGPTGRPRPVWCGKVFRK